MSLDLGFGKPLAHVTITSGWFRPRAGHRHEGLDMPLNVGDPVFAVARGTVRRVQPRSTSPAGKFVEVSHAKGWVSRYLHLDSTAVQTGQRVSKGQVIGRGGRTGVKASGAHLHFELRLDPAQVPAYAREFGTPTTGFGRTFSSGVAVPVEPLIPADVYRPLVVADARKHGVLLRSIDFPPDVPTWFKVAAVGVTLGAVGVGTYLLWDAALGDNGRLFGTLRGPKIKMTPTEAGIADWAVEVMPEYGEELEADEPGTGWGEEDVPTVKGRVLDLGPVHPGAIDDLLYRLREQWPDLAEEGETDLYYGYVKKGWSSTRADRAAALKTKRQIDAGYDLARKIREASG
jgi:hypothetical protein